MTAAEVQEQTAPRSAARRGRRVLMGVPAPGATGGGPALHLPMLVADLRQAGCEVETFSYGRWSEGESLPRKAWNQLRDLLRYPGLVRRVRPDLVHLNTAFDRKAIARDVPFALASRLLGVPVFLKWHGSETDLLESRSPLWRPMVSVLLGAVQGIGVLSSEEAEALGRRSGAPRRVVVRNGLDLDRYTGRRAVRQQFGLPDTAPLLLFIGRLIPAKGLDDVVRALPAIAAHHDAHLVVAGDGPAKAPAMARAEELGIAARVHFVGQINEEEAADYYCGCDVLVFPTYHPEGFPMTVFQSLAGGLGIVTTRLRATADYLREAENALFVPPRDPAALARAVLRLLDDPQLLSRMRQTNRELARRFDRRAVAAEFGAIYDAVLQPGAERRAGGGWMNVVGIHDGHTAAAALLRDGKMVAAVQEERFTRIKNWAGFPAQSVRWILQTEGLGPADVDAVVFNGLQMPYAKSREEILAEYERTGSLGTTLKRFLRRTAIKTVRDEKRRADRRKAATKFGFPADKTHFLDHHSAHAAGAYYGWGKFDEPILVLTNDGAGDGLCASVSIGEKGRLRRLASVPESESIGNIYAMITFLMGMVPLEHEYKLMGMAPYASEKSSKQVYDLFRSLVEFRPDNPLVWERRNGCPETYYSYEFFRELLELKRFDAVCGGLQMFAEDMLATWARNAIQKTGIHKLALAGGCFMNVKANKVILEMPEVEDLFVLPSCGDESSAMATAWWWQAQQNLDKGGNGPGIVPLGDVYLGPEASRADEERALERFKASEWLEVESNGDLEARAAELLAAGEVVARCRGRMEFGARSLGNRAILADPTKPEVIRIINEMVKNRDFWMPFAPSILAECETDYVVNPKRVPAPYMILSFDTTSRVEELAAAIHPYDRSARPQIVSREWNPGYHHLISEFRRRTGRGAILNTSFNLHGFPIANTPEDALEVLRNSGLDYLLLNHFLVHKRVSGRTAPGTA